MVFTAVLPCMAEETEIVSAAEEASEYEADWQSDTAAQLPSYKSSDSYNTSTNTDNIWRWQYKDPDSNKTYTDLDKTGNCGRVVSINGINYPAGQSWKINDYTNGFALSKYVMVGGNHGDGSGWADTNTAVKTFIAPKSGNITITACGPDDTENGKIWSTVSSGNPQGAKICINKNNQTIWPENSDGYRFMWDSAAENNGLVLSFEPINISVNKGDRLHFEVLSGGSTNWWGTAVFWDPMVSYTSFNPTVDSVTASGDDFENAELDQSYSVIFEDELNSISESNIEISGILNDGSELKKTPYVNNTELSADNKTVTFSFSNLEKGASYTVTLKNMDFTGMDAGTFEYSFTFNTKKPASSISYKASDAYSETTNDNTIWKWQYRNDYINYVDLDKTGWAKVAVNSGETKVSADKSWVINDYGYGFALSKYVMVGGNIADGNSTSNSDTAVRTFIAPKSGYIQIGASDADGNSKIWSNLSRVNTPGASVSVKKTDADDEQYLKTKTIWPENGTAYQFKWDASNPEECRQLDFEPIIVKVNAGDKLHFEASAKGGNWWGMVVYWDPVVSYKSVFPEAYDKNFEDGGTYVPNYKYSMEFDDDMEALSADDITIDNGASVKSVDLEGSKRITFSFDGIKEGVKYTVTVNGLRYDSVSDSTLSEPYTFSFVGGGKVEIKDARLGAAHLKKGENKVFVTVNNSAAEKCSASVLACVMKGTADNYEVESVGYATRNDIGENDTMSISVNLPDEKDRFIRVFVVKSVNGLWPYAEAIDLK